MVRGSVKRILGYLERDLIGILLTDLMSELREVDLVGDAEASRSWSLDVPVVAGDGRILQMNLSFAPLASGAENSGYVIVARDITARVRGEEQIRILSRELHARMETQSNQLQVVTKERRELEKQLRESQKLESLGTLAGGIAHDFNNILSIIMAHNSLVRRREVDNPHIATCVDAIHLAVQRGSSVVRQLLTFARKTATDMQPVCVNEIVNELREIIWETFPKTIELTTHLESNIPAVSADKNQIHQALLNLLVNARDSMDGSGRLTVSTSFIDSKFVQLDDPEASPNGYVQVRVTDTGVGMDEQTRSRIFEPFFTTKDVGKGTGLGLAVVYGIVKEHLGYIKVDSKPGRGAAFEILLPVATDILATRSVSEKPAKVEGGRETILVVEDEPSLRTVSSAVLKESGYKVLTASDGMEAVEQFNRHRDEIKLVLSDVGLPRMNGLEAVQKMLDMHPELKVIITSGYLDTTVRDQIKKSNIPHFLPKPFSLGDMLKMVRDAMDGGLKKRATSIA